MCIKKLIAYLFNPPKPVVIPFPVELENPTAKAIDISVSDMLNQWRVKYAVTDDSWVFWSKIDIQIVDGWPINIDPRVSAYSCTDNQDFSDPTKSHIRMRAVWASIGVLSFEIDHISYGNLSDEQKQNFSDTLAYIINTESDALIVKVIKDGFCTVDGYAVDAHAQIYRCCGGQMPEALKQYYPKLF